MLRCLCLYVICIICIDNIKRIKKNFKNDIINEFLKVMNIRNYFGKDVLNLVLMFNFILFIFFVMLEGKLKSKMLL